MIRYNIILPVPPLRFIVFHFFLGEFGAIFYLVTTSKILRSNRVVVAWSPHYLDIKRHSVTICPPCLDSVTAVIPWGVCCFFG